MVALKWKYQALKASPTLRLIFREIFRPSPFNTQANDQGLLVGVGFSWKERHWHNAGISFYT